MQPGDARIGSADRMCIAVSAKTGEGLDQFESLLADTGKAMACEKESSDEASLNSRCLLLTQTAQLVMANLMEDLDRTLRPRPEIMSLELRRVLALMEEMTGERVEEGILDRIFERFCVGK